MKSHRSFSCVTPALTASIIASMSLLAASGCERREQAPGEPGAMKPTEPQPTAPVTPPPPGEPGEPAATPPPGEPVAQGTPGAEGAQGARRAEDPDLAILTITAVDIDTKLAAMCGIPESRVYFKFDSAKLSPDAKERLDQIVTCAMTGAAKGRELLIVGRTDPVGPDEYNKKLGRNRAESVSEYLRAQGVKGQRVEIESKGEQGAPTSAMQWPDARRVTIRLQE